MKRILALVTILLCAGALTLHAAEKKTNILLILADDLKYHDLGFTGTIWKKFVNHTMPQVYPPRSYHDRQNTKT